MNKPEEYINEYGKECYKNVTYQTKLSDLEFYEVPRYNDENILAWQDLLQQLEEGLF